MYSADTWAYGRQECACAWCGGPLREGHRAGTRYCGSSCRARASVWRRSPEGVAAREAREADPAHQARLAQYKALAAIAGDTVRPEVRARDERIRTARRTGETCAECGRALGEVVFWRPVNSKGTSRAVRVLAERGDRRSAPVCPGCCCPAWWRHEGKDALPASNLWCERCRPAERAWAWDLEWGISRPVSGKCPDWGPGHHGTFCSECHPSRWYPGRCPGCQRTVMFRHGAERRRWRRDPDRPWAITEIPYGQPVPAYCSTQCRDQVNRAAAAARRAAERAPVLCAHCGEVMDGQRAGARYCSPACRQAAYRARQAAESNGASRAAP